MKRREMGHFFKLSNTNDRNEDVMVGNKKVITRSRIMNFLATHSEVSESFAHGLRAVNTLAPTQEDGSFVP